LSIALDAERYETRIFERHGHQYPIFTLRWQGHKIWGATAAILMNLLSRMQSTHEQ
jgi:hypothetical protein